MDLRELRKETAAILAEARVDSPRLEADLLIHHITGWERASLLAHPERLFPDGLFPVLAEALERRAAREPLQYITGVCEFMGRTFRVGPGCLVPRPETELLVLESSKYFREGTFLDWGTGSGCIAASILLENPESRCVAVDGSPRAIAWAWRNFKERGLLGRCLLCHSPSFERIPMPPGGFGMIVSNPPYIPTGVIPGLMPEVSRYEPLCALDGGDDGSDHYRSLARWARTALAPGGALIVEMGSDEQAEELISVTRGAMTVLSVVRDLRGSTRVVVLMRSPF
ncbi:MAG: Release factor glutamine methyltransferase [Synergistetes bacterium ADurb.Bin155]|nr:peptide chain release factor N(5)-glutamine methyltransferase [Synergistales bacterium]NMD18167.1 peptide chain release factor N(5)-glutamine methyltransferase [Synergistaceae bacterium]OQB45511.1 MAG: Release factor glutamine methyltransferase [Synergistetes bacterium ADurb.Bin155]HOC81569.1 peptide chain release factor N(5)-glutamine methyltransferase [Synergistales bacterium]